MPSADPHAPIAEGELEALAAKARKATPGQWEVDRIPTDGSYGSGEDCHEGYDEFGIFSADGHQIASTENRACELSEVDEEYDEDRHNAWNELSKRDAEFIVAAQPSVVLRLIAALRHSRAQEAGVTDGWVLVPREPTQTMLDAVSPFPEHLSASHPDPEDPWHGQMRAATMADQATCKATYRAMLAAAPPAQSTEADALRDLVTFWFSPWGAAKGVMWEDMSGDLPFTAENMLKVMQRALAGSAAP